LYRIPLKVRHRIDQLRKNFLWYGDNNVNKKQEGLGVLDIDIMNKALLAKWLIRYKDPMVKGYWKSILIYKYSKSKDIVSLSSQRSSVSLTQKVNQIISKF
jgi:hypothetical protein